MNSRAARGVSVLFALALALAGCAGLPFGRDESMLGSRESFEMQGRVFARYSDRAFSGSLRWRHVPGADELWLGGPLGQTAAHIVRDGSGATLTTAEQQTYHSLSLEESMRRAMGWALPLADLSFYVLGELPAGVDETAVKRNAERQLVAVVHDGWEIEFTPSDGEAARPVRLRMRKETVEVRLVIDRLEAAQG